MNTQELKLKILADLATQGVQPSQQLDLAKPIFEWMTEPNAEEKRTNGPHIVVGFPFPELDGLKLGELIERIRTDPNSPTIIQRYDAPDTPNVTHQTPEEVLRANGWNRYSDNPIGYTNPEEALKVVCGNGRWFIQKVGAGHENNKPIYWNHEVSPIFEDWLCAQVAALPITTPEMVANNTGVSPTAESVLRENGWVKRDLIYEHAGSPNLYIKLVENRWTINTVSGYPVPYLIWDGKRNFREWLDEQVQYMNHVNGSNEKPWEPEKAEPKTEGLLSMEARGEILRNEGMHCKSTETGAKMWFFCHWEHFVVYVYAEKTMILRGSKQEIHNPKTESFAAWAKYNADEERSEIRAKANDMLHSIGEKP